MATHGSQVHGARGQKFGPRPIRGLPISAICWSHLGVCIDKLMSIHSILCLFHSDPRSGEIYNGITFTAVMSSYMSYDASLIRSYASINTS